MMSASVGVGSQVTDTGLLSDGWGARASAIGIYNRSQHFTFMAGLAYNSLSQDFKLVPVVGCDWRPTEKWSFAFGFPKTGVTYKLNKQLALGLAASGSGGVFYVKNDPLGATPRSLDKSHLQYLRGPRRQRRLENKRRIPRLRHDGPGSVSTVQVHQPRLQIAIAQHRALLLRRGLDLPLNPA